MTHQYFYDTHLCSALLEARKFVFSFLNPLNILHPLTAGGQVFLWRWGDGQPGRRGFQNSEWTGGMFVFFKIQWDRWEAVKEKSPHRLLFDVWKEDVKEPRYVGHRSNASHICCIFLPRSYSTFDASSPLWSLPLLSLHSVSHSFRISFLSSRPSLTYLFLPVKYYPSRPFSPQT